MLCVPFRWGKVVLHPKPCLILTTTSWNREASCGYSLLVGFGPTSPGSRPDSQTSVNYYRASLHPHPPTAQMSIEHSLGRKLRVRISRCTSARVSHEDRVRFLLTRAEGMPTRTPCLPWAAAEDAQERQSPQVRIPPCFCMCEGVF